MPQNLLQQIAKTFGVFVCLMFLVAGVWFACGWAHINASGGTEFGLYASVLKNLGAYWNPLANLFQLTIMISLLCMPFVLLAFRKRLKCSALPWVMALCGLVGLALSGYSITRGDLIDEEASSLWTFPRFWIFYLPSLIGLIVGYAIIAVRTKSTSGSK